jgi:hypothetical protein
MFAWFIQQPMLQPVTVASTNFVTKRYRMSYTLGRAAKSTGLSKMTISRAIKKGTISASKNDNGGYTIEPSELHRVFPAITVIQSHDGNNVTKRYPDDTPLLHRIKELEIRLEVTQERLEETKDERDNWRQQAQRLLLAHNKPVETDEKIAATLPTKNPLRLPSDKIFGLAVVISMAVLGAIFWPDIIARL